MVCHGELAQLRPSPARADGLLSRHCRSAAALGAAFVTLVAPRLFTWYLELPLLFMLDRGRAARRSAAAIWRASTHGSWPASPRSSAPARSSTSGAIVLRPLQREGLVASGRGFYGMLRVFDEGPAGEARAQAVARADRARRPGARSSRARTQGRLVLRARQRHRDGGRPASAARSGPAAQDRSRRARVRDRGRARAAVRSRPFLRDRPAGRPILESVLHVSQGLARADRGLTGRRAALARARDGVRAESTHL